MVTASQSHLTVASYLTNIFFRKTNFIHFRKFEKDICLEVCSLIYIYGKCGNVCMMGKQTYKFLYTILWYVYSRIWYWSVNNVAFLLSWASCVKTKKNLNLNSNYQILIFENMFSMHCLVPYELELYKIFDHNVPNMYEVFQYDFIPNQIIVDLDLRVIIYYHYWLFHFI